LKKPPYHCGFHGMLHEITRITAFRYLLFGIIEISRQLPFGFIPAIAVSREPPHGPVPAMLGETG
jgi:hypothetical protein